MNRVTLSELREVILDQADMANSSFISTTKLDYWINAAFSELHDLLVLSFEDYFHAIDTFDLSSVTDYPLPEDFYKARKVFWVTGDQKYKLSPYTLETYDAYKNEYASPNYDNRSVKYRILGSQISFTPDPNANGSIELHYIPQFKKLRQPDDEIHYAVPVGWDEYVVADVVARCLAKEESDPSYFLARKQEIKARIVQAAADRDTGEGHRVRDVSNRFGVGWDDQ